MQLSKRCHNGQMVGWLTLFSCDCRASVSEAGDEKSQGEQLFFPYCIDILLYVFPGSGIGRPEQASATNVPWVTSLMGFWPGSPVSWILQSPNNKFMEMYNSIRGSSVTCEYVCCHVVMVVSCFVNLEMRRKQQTFWTLNRCSQNILFCCQMMRRVNICGGRRASMRVGAVVLTVFSISADCSTRM